MVAVTRTYLVRGHVVQYRNLRVAAAISYHMQHSTYCMYVQYTVRHTVFAREKETEQRITDNRIITVIFRVSISFFFDVLN